MTNFNFQKYLIDHALPQELLKDFQNNFLIPDILPGGDKCMFKYVSTFHCICFSHVLMTYILLTFQINLSCRLVTLATRMDHYYTFPRVAETMVPLFTRMATEP